MDNLRIKTVGSYLYPYFSSSVTIKKIWNSLNIFALIINLIYYRYYIILYNSKCFTYLMGFAWRITREVNVKADYIRYDGWPTKGLSQINSTIRFEKKDFKLQFNFFYHRFLYNNEVVIVWWTVGFYRLGLGNFRKITLLEFPRILKNPRE